MDGNRSQRGGRRESNASHADGVRWRRDRRFERGKRTKEDALLSEVTHRGHAEVTQRSRKGHAQMESSASASQRLGEFKTVSEQRPGAPIKELVKSWNTLERALALRMKGWKDERMEGRWRENANHRRLGNHGEGQNSLSDGFIVSEDEMVQAPQAGGSEGEHRFPSFFSLSKVGVKQTWLPIKGS